MRAKIGSPEVMEGARSEWVGSREGKGGGEGNKKK